MLARLQAEQGWLVMLSDVSAGAAPASQGRGGREGNVLETESWSNHFYGTPVIFLLQLSLQGDRKLSRGKRGKPGTEERN